MIPELFAQKEEVVVLEVAAASNSAGIKVSVGGGLDQARINAGYCDLSTPTLYRLSPCFIRVLPADTKGHKSVKGVFLYPDTQHWVSYKPGLPGL